MAEYTPGPWTTESDVFDDVEGRVPTLYSPDHGLLATFFAIEREFAYANPVNNMSPQAVANAALCADAPLLLTSLSRLLDWTDVGCEDPTCGKHSELRAVVDASRELVARHTEEAS